MGEPWAAGLTNIYPTTAVSVFTLSPLKALFNPFFQKNKDFFMNYFLFAAALLILIDLVICAVLLCKGFALLRKLDRQTPE